MKNIIIFGSRSGIEKFDKAVRKLLNMEKRLYIHKEHIPEGKNMQKGKEWYPYSNEPYDGYPVVLNEQPLYAFPKFSLDVRSVLDFHDLKNGRINNDASVHVMYGCIMEFKNCYAYVTNRIVYPAPFGLEMFDNIKNLIEAKAKECLEVEIDL